MAKCAENLANGLRPMIVTVPRAIPGFDSLAEAAGLADRIDLLDIEQFLATNLHERATFQSAQQRPKIAALIERYNELVDTHENDPSLRIEPVG